MDNFWSQINLEEKKIQSEIIINIFQNYCDKQMVVNEDQVVKYVTVLGIKSIIMDDSIEIIKTISKFQI